ncbi:MAG: pantoate--beta-alanine ligase [Wenzhouxiangellaceae bacterium]
MIEAHSRGDLQQALAPHRQAGRRIALVPTMGNLHAGHLSLVELAAQHADVVVTSVFVNPTQFAPGEDFDRYPRTLSDDRTALESSPCDVLFAPGVADMYPAGIDNTVIIKPPPKLANRLCGASRPGHFDGVLTVVARLLLISLADVAVFGEKDYQQLLLIEHMCHELGLGARIVRAPVVRESSGLAMSSRNQYLQPAQRQLASALYATLLSLQARIRQGERDLAGLEADGCRQLRDRNIEVEYLQIVAAETLQQPIDSDRQLRILVAARLPGARLIDNLAVDLI